jgi:hypothetical protein
LVFWEIEILGKIFFLPLILLRTTYGEFMKTMNLMKDIQADFKRKEEVWKAMLLA